MDISKLPRMSKTEGQAPSSETPPTEPSATQSAPRPVAVVYREPGLGLEMWITVILALIFLALGRQFASYAIATAGHRPFHTQAFWDSGPKAGEEVDYHELAGLAYWSDSAMLFFGIALLVSGASLAVATLRWHGRRLFGWLAMIVIIAAAVYNGFVAVKLVAADITPLLSLLCIGLGGYEIYLQYRAIKPLTGG